MSNRNQNNGHLSHYAGLYQLGPTGGVSGAGGGHQGLIVKSSKAASKPKRLSFRVAVSDGQRKKPPITLPTFSWDKP